MENLIGGTEALTMLGVNKKSGRATELLKPFGIDPVFAKKIGRGTTVFVKREDVAAALVKVERQRSEERADLAKRQTEFIRAGEKTRFVPTAEALEVLKRLEAKMDRLLMMWGDKDDS